MPSKKSTAVHGFSIEEVTRELRKTEFVRDSSKKQYKTVNGKRFTIHCSCKSPVSHIPNFMAESVFRIGKGAPACSLCGSCSYIDITSLNLPEE